MRTHNVYLIGHVERRKDVCRFAHDREVRIASHHDADQYVAALRHKIRSIRVTDYALVRSSASSCISSVTRTSLALPLC